MSLPNINGFTSREPSLATEWEELGQFEFTELVPIQTLTEILRHPTQWITVDRQTKGRDSGGVSTMIISKDAQSAALGSAEWSNRTIGEFSVLDDKENRLGLSEPLGGGIAEFFCRVQEQHGPRPPAVEIAHPFIWYWNAIRSGNDWFYLDGAGIEHQLVRTTFDSDGGYQVEVSALELRRYLGQRDVLALIQHDQILWANVSLTTRKGLEFRSDWGAFDWNAVKSQMIVGQSANSLFFGKYIVSGLVGRPAPSWLDNSPESYPEFIYQTDSETGQSRSFTCEPEKLGNYFGKNPHSPHYLTPIHFDSRLLNRYQDEPDQYVVTTTRITGPNMWSISIGRTSSGDVEAYLGDIGRDLPWQEHAYWRSHNISPRGKMSEDRFRRDFLGQWTGDPTPLERLREAYTEVNVRANERLGWPIFRPLAGEDAVGFDRLQPPTLTSLRELVRPIVLLNKTLVDSINSKRIRSLLGPSDVPSIALLERFVEHLGGDKTIVGPIRDLNKLRSAGGVAHLAGDGRLKLFEDIGITGLTPGAVVDLLASRLADCLVNIGQLFTPQS